MAKLQLTDVEIYVKDLKAAMKTGKSNAEENGERPSVSKSSAPVVKKASTSPELPKKRSGALSIMGSLDKLMAFKRK